MAIASTTSLVDALRQFRLLEPVQLEEVTGSLQSLFPDPKALAKELIQRGWLTPYQANQLLQGKGQDLVLGSYILLEKLGEGGMGQVFKGRNWKMGRIVALKLIRKERLVHPDAVHRFQREVRSAAALAHPNIVAAYDADEIAGTHLLVMEYIEGAIDLAKLVKKDGPLPVLQACEYIRQAALGLQHAYERGMVHRDIKPANLLLADRGKVVKVLDLGLARLDHSLHEDDDKSSTMTQEGAVMGTPDYLSPEQAQESHTVDIRADLYSLGCTFYFLLSGRVPFPGGSFIDKLFRHRLEEPKPVEQLRPEVAPAIARVVRTLMAKKPEDRFQTPADVVLALAAACSQGSGLAGAGIAHELTIAEQGQADAVQEVKRDTLVSAYSNMEKRDDTVPEPPLRLNQPAPKQRWLWYGIVGACALVLAFGGLTIFYSGKDAPNPNEGEIGKQGGAKKPSSKREDDPLQQARSLLGGKWHYIGPFDNFQMKGFDRIYPPEKEINLKAVYPGKNNQPVRWQEYPGFQVGVTLDFLTLIEKAKDKEWGCIYLYHSIEVAEEASIPISLGSDDTLTVWLNDERLLNKKVSRGVQPGDDFTILKLQPGKNRLLVKICQSTGEWGFYVSPVKQSELPFYMQPGFDPWLKQVASSPAAKQLEAVAAKLHELNPGFDGKVTHKKDKEIVTELGFVSDNVTDISPVRALSGLRTLSCAGSEWWGKGALADLSPLKDMKLTNLDVHATKVYDLAPLRDMKLASLGCSCTQVSDLSPLKDARLISLNCFRTKVSDLAPLKDMKLTNLDVRQTKVADLSPLKGMLLTSLNCGLTPVTDLSPLQGMPLKTLGCPFKLERDADILRSLKSLENINGKPARDFWKDVDKKKLEKMR